MGEIGLRRDAVLAVLLRPSVEEGHMDTDEVSRQFGESVARILHGLLRIQELYQKNPVVETENFRKGREIGIQRLMSINLLKRMESSVHSFLLFTFMGFLYFTMTSSPFL